MRSRPDSPALDNIRTEKLGAEFTIAFQAPGLILGFQTYWNALKDCKKARWRQERGLHGPVGRAEKLNRRTTGSSP